MVKNLPGMQEARVQSLDEEDCLGEGVFLPGESHALCMGLKE